MNRRLLDIAMVRAQAKMEVARVKFLINYKAVNNANLQTENRGYAGENSGPTGNNSSGPVQGEQGNVPV